MTLLMLCLFWLNFPLILADAAMAYRRMPMIIAVTSSQPDGIEGRVATVRSLLPLLVALYTVLNLHAHAEADPVYLAGLTLLIFGDMAAQIFLCRRFHRSSID